LTTRSTFPPEDDEDTIELELTAAEMRGLSRAARKAYATRVDSAGKRAIRLWPMALAAALVGVAAIVAWRPGPPHQAAPRTPPTPAIATTPPPASQPAALLEPQELQKPQELDEPQRPPMRVRNPFDAKEVFEFPAGTTKAEARKKVSEILLQRAVDRGSAGNVSETVDKHRSKNN
jgi:hypothetical protein